MSDHIITVNLKRIRHAKRLSQDRIAELSGLSRSAYRNIETGKAKPRVRTLQGIASALGVPLQELLAPAVALQRVRFRSTKKLRTRSQILADVGRWLRDYNALEDILDDHPSYKLSGLAEHLPEDSSRITALAQATRDALGLTRAEPVRDICGLLDSAGIKVFPMQVASDGFFGLSVAPSDGGPAVAVNAWERISVERRIFSAAHELGHLLLHLDDFSADDDAENDAHEREANAFAASFLMPDEVFWREWNDAYGLGVVDRVIKVKRIFRVSYRTVLSRLAPHYQGWGNIWVRFQSEYKKSHGRTLTKLDEPAGLPDDAFFSGAPEAMRGGEPDHLSDADFREDRLPGLVRKAIEAEEISVGRGGEILGLSLLEMRARVASWVR